MGKLTHQERELAKSIIAAMSIKRVPDGDIIKEIKQKTNKSLSRISLYYLRQQIKKESYHWYKTMREGQDEYIYEFKERISEIIDLQKIHHQIIDSATEPTTVKQASMVELRRLNITLSNYFNVAPDIIGHTISTPSEAKTTQPEAERTYIV